MSVKVVDQRGNPVVDARVVVRELMSRSLRRIREHNRENTDSIRGVTDANGCFRMRIPYECRVEVAVDGRIYGVFLLDTGVTITIKVKDY